MLERGDLFRKNHFVSMAGPCAIESEAQALAIALKLREIGEQSEESRTDVYRGCIFKPRSKPDSYQGIGIEIGIEAGLSILSKVKSETGLLIVTEVVDPRQVRELEQVVDIWQVGSRNCQNFALLTELAQMSRKPVLLKRGASCTVDEWIGAADYIGRDRVILCERGIRTPVDETRYTLDISAITAAKERSGMPVIGDPSHPAGERKYVPDLMMAIAANSSASGAITEVHNNPEVALCDGPQQLLPESYGELLRRAREVHRIVSMPLVCGAA